MTFISWEREKYFPPPYRGFSGRLFHPFFAAERPERAAVPTAAPAYREAGPLRMPSREPLFPDGDVARRYFSLAKRFKLFLGQAGLPEFGVRVVGKIGD